MKRVIGALLAVGVCLVPQIAASPTSSASASIFYVATGGNDTGNCQSSTTPCATISYALSQISVETPSPTIDVGPGTFNASPSEAEGLNVTIQGTDSGTAPVTTVEPEDSGGSIFEASRSGWTLNQLTVNGLTGDPITAGYAGTVNVVNSTITNSDVAVSVGGPTSDVHITDSTISGNTIGVESTDASSEVDITASTIADNDLGLGGSLLGMSLAGTIVSDNSGGDCAIGAGTVNDAGYNLDDDGSCGFSPTDHSQSDVDAYLGPLDNGGGPTETQAPIDFSPAVNQIPMGSTGNGVTLCPGMDQRGVYRPQGTDCDIGALELTGGPWAITSAPNAVATAGSTFSFTVTTFGKPVPTFTTKPKLPKNLKLVNDENGDATISGIPKGVPKKVHVYSFRINVTFGTGPGRSLARQVFTLTVNPR
jgi:hypothetical protein